MVRNIEVVVNIDNVIDVNATFNNIDITSVEIEKGAAINAPFSIYDGATTPLYVGDYEYTPMVTSQIIQCSQKKMTDNVTIHPIHTRETQDSTGGINFEIINGL